ncbi:MAG TPA: class II aldolase/adducin family protein [Bacteroidales bacterium]|nr:class II aldolase/adducin family protein [Bacteroidales bacterium]
MAIDPETCKSFDLAGKNLSNRGYNSSHSGNLSIRSGGKIIITRRSSMLGWLEPEDLVEISLDDEDAHSGLIASIESNVHRTIYKETDAMATVHAHAPAITALSMIQDEITCTYEEGMYLYKKIPIVECDVPVGSYEVAEKVAPLLKNSPTLVVRAHGVFAKRVKLEDALGVLTGVEQSADIIYQIKLMGIRLKREYSIKNEFSN